MKNYEKFNLAENEFHLLCDFMNGTMLELASLNWRSSLLMDLLEANELNGLETKWETDIDVLNKKLTVLTRIELLELLVEVDLFFNVEEDTYSCLEKISPKSKIVEILNSTEKHEPMIWKSGAGPLSDFFMISEALGMDMIIYVQDSEGNNKSVWSTSNEDLMDCFVTFSDKCYFGRVQKIENAIRYGFFDFVENNVTDKSA